MIQGTYELLKLGKNIALLGRYMEPWGGSVGEYDKKILLGMFSEIKVVNL